MGKKKNRQLDLQPRDNQRQHKNTVSQKGFERKNRGLQCLHAYTKIYLSVRKLDGQEVRQVLASECSTIEHQIIYLRALTQLNQSDFRQRLNFTRQLLACLYKHHKVIYEGILFGSTVNGLGFKDSDVDLRLRALEKVGPNLYEPVNLDDEVVGKTLKDIAYRTTQCCPSRGEYVPSVRCPVAKLKFYSYDLEKQKVCREKDGLSFDISLLSKNSLGSFNSAFLKFLCRLQPKFHLLAIVLRYWSKSHKLIQPGDLSSYALINMLIFFCQTVQPPLLPTVDEMRQLYLDHETELDPEYRHNPSHAITRAEWQCLVCLDEDLYPPSKNTDPLCVVLLKFFEFYLKFPFATHIITIRPGKALDHQEFPESCLFHPMFPVRKFVNIQDPFDLKHNLTSGLEGSHFSLFMKTVRYSYEKLHREIMTNFLKPKQLAPDFSLSEINGCQENDKANNKKSSPSDEKDWGLNVIFKQLTEQEKKDT